MGHDAAHLMIAGGYFKELRHAVFVGYCGMDDVTTAYFRRLPYQARRRFYDNARPIHHFFKEYTVAATTPIVRPDSAASTNIPFLLFLKNVS